MLPPMDEDQSVSSVYPDSSAGSVSSQRKRRKSTKSTTSGRLSDGNSLASGDRSSTGSEDEGNAWADIFAPCKLMVRMESRNLGLPNSKTLITHAEQDFFTNFEYDMKTSLPLPLDNLFGPPTVRKPTRDIVNAILNGKNITKFINLYTATGSALSCHVVVMCVKGKLPSGPIMAKTREDCKPNYAVLTIRSASLIGNAKQYGIGFFGPNTGPDTLNNDEESVDNGRRKRARTCSTSEESR